jgi:hypothetical protein
MVKRTDPFGNVYNEPPYTPEEIEWLKSLFCRPPVGHACPPVRSLDFSATMRLRGPQCGRPPRGTPWCAGGC